MLEPFEEALSTDLQKLLFLCSVHNDVKSFEYVDEDPQLISKTIDDLHTLVSTDILKLHLFVLFLIYNFPRVKLIVKGEGI